MDTEFNKLSKTTFTEGIKSKINSLKKVFCKFKTKVFFNTKSVACYVDLFVNFLVVFL